jgi:hypothetical protein
MNVSLGGFRALSRKVADFSDKIMLETKESDEAAPSHRNPAFSSLCAAMRAPAAAPRLLAQASRLK